jgi:hypothetical protein
MLALIGDSVSAAKTATEARIDTMNSLNDLIIGIYYYTSRPSCQQVFSSSESSQTFTNLPMY